MGRNGFISGCQLAGLAMLFSSQILNGSLFLLLFNREKFSRGSRSYLVVTGTVCSKVSKAQNGLEN